MGENAVENDGNAHAFGFSAQLLELLVGAEEGVSLHIVGGIVPVVFVGLENGIEVYAGNSQTFKVGEL